MHTQTILETKNWTGLTFAELCEAGRIGSRQTVKNWVQDTVNAKHEGLSFEEIDKLDFRAVMDEIDLAINEICKLYSIQ